jgi:hypothetical protein
MGPAYAYVGRRILGLGSKDSSNGLYLEGGMGKMDRFWYSVMKLSKMGKAVQGGLDAGIEREVVRWKGDVGNVGMFLLRYV